MRRVGAVHSGHRTRRGLQVRDQGTAGRAAAAQGGPLRLRRGAPAAHRVGGAWPGRAPLERSGLDARTGRGQCARRADLDLRVPPRLLDARARGRQPLSQLSRAGRPAGAVCQGHGLHPSRADAGLGISLRRLVGLSADRPVRADQPPRRSCRLRRLRRRLPPGRHRAAARLGARPFSDRSARSGPVRRHPSLRARRPAPGVPARLEHADLQLRPQGGREFPARQRVVLAEALPRRRAARGCGRLDALPRLLAQGGRMDPERVRRQRESRCDRAAASA